MICLSEKESASEDFEKVGRTPNQFRGSRRKLLNLRNLMPPRVWGGRSKTNGLIGKAIKEPDIDFSHFVREQEMGLQKRWVAGLDLSSNTKTNTMTKRKTNQCGER